MNKIVFRITFIIALVASSYYYNLSFKQTVPQDFDGNIILRQTISAMGSKTVTTVFIDGKVLVVSDFTDMNVSYLLDKQHLDKIQTLILAAGPEVRMFIPKPDILYEGSYTLETNVNEYLLHTKSDDQLKAIIDYINSSKTKAENRSSQPF